MNLEATLGRNRGAAEDLRQQLDSLREATSHPCQQSVQMPETLIDFVLSTGRARLAVDRAQHIFISPGGLTLSRMAVGVKKARLLKAPSHKWKIL